MKFTNPFELNPNINSFIVPITKILLCVVFMIVLFYRDRFFPILNKVLDIALAIIFTCVSILIIYISIAEIIELHYKNKDYQILSKKSDVFNISKDEILDLLDKNDCMDITVLNDYNIIHIGVASDNHVGDSAYFGKIYYIDTKFYETCESFEETIEHLSNGRDYLRVIMIDDISPSNYSHIHYRRNQSEN